MAGLEMYDLERLSTSSIEGKGTFPHYIKPRKDKDETSDQKTKELAISITRLKIVCFVIVATVFLIAAAAGLFIYQLMSKLENMEDRVAISEIVANADTTAKTVEYIESRLAALESNITEDISNLEHLNANLSIDKSERKGDILVLQQHIDKLTELASNALHTDQIFQKYESRLKELEHNRTEDISVFGHLNARLLVLESHKQKDLSVLQQQSDKFIELESNTKYMKKIVEKYELRLADLEENITEDISNFEQLNSRILDIDSNRRDDLTILHQLNSTLLRFHSDRLDNFAILQELNATLTNVGSVSKNNAELLLQQENKLNKLKINQLRDDMISKEFNSSMSELRTQRNEDVLMFTRQLENLAKLETSQLEDHLKLQTYEHMFTRTHALIEQLNISIEYLESDRNANEELLQLFNSTMIIMDLDRKHKIDFLQQLDSRLTEAESRRENREEKSMVGFTAKGVQKLPNGVLIYNKVLSEVNGRFNNNTGVFTCSIAGLYLVSITLEAETDGRVDRHLFKDGLRTGIKIDIYEKGQELASQTAVLKLDKWESLYIGSYDERSNVVGETTFTVVLIQADT